MKAIWTIARRELNSLFDHPMGYIMLVVFIGLNNFLFFAQAYQAGVAELRPMLGLLPWLFLFFIPETGCTLEVLVFYSGILFQFESTRAL